jgi:hypothetical protein
MVPHVCMWCGLMCCSVTRPVSAAISDIHPGLLAVHARLQLVPSQSHAYPISLSHCHLTPLNRPTHLLTYLLTYSLTHSLTPPSRPPSIHSLSLSISLSISLSLSLPIPLSPYPHLFLPQVEEGSAIFNNSI